MKYWYRLLYWLGLRNPARGYQKVLSSYLTNELLTEELLSRKETENE